MNKTTLGLILLIGGFSLPGAAPVQAEKVAVILSRSEGPYVQALKGIQQAGLYEVETFPLEGDSNRGRQIAESLSSSLAGVIPIGSEAVLALRGLKADIPVVYTMVLEPMDFPGHNASGVIIKLGIREQLMEIRKLFPSCKRIGVLFNRASSGKDINLARSLVVEYGLSLHPVEVEDEQDVPQVLPRLSRDYVDLIWMVVDNVANRPNALKALIAHTVKENLPLIGLSVYHVKAGALAAFSTDFTEIGVQTAELLKAGKWNQVATPKNVLVYVNADVQKRMEIDLSGFSEVRVIQP